MSFVKLPRKYPTKPQHGSRSGKGKKKKPEWDDSVNDLTVHKASTEDLHRRKLVATSQNIEAVREDQMRRKIAQAQHKKRNPHQNAFLKEVLYDNVQLHDVLAKSDRMMAVVKDLFGDNPQKYHGAPNVTLAPEHASANGALPDMDLGPSRLDILSESVMDRTALNTDDDEYTDVESVEYESAVDMARFERLLELAQEDENRRGGAGRGEVTSGSRSRPVLTESTADTLLHQLAAKLGLGGNEPLDDTLEANDLESPRSSKGDENKTKPESLAMNDTSKVIRTRSRLTHEERAASPDFAEMAPSETSSDMNSLRKVLDGLEHNIGEYEKMIGREPSIASSLTDESLSGFTSRLVNAVNKITRYMRENEVRLRAECTLREQLHQDAMFLRQLVDTLTNDILITQEQHAGMKSEFERYKRQTSEEINFLKSCVEAAGIPLHKTAMSAHVQSASNAQPVIPSQSTQQPRPSMQHHQPHTIQHLQQQMQQGPHQMQQQQNMQQFLQQQQKKQEAVRDLRDQHQQYQFNLQEATMAQAAVQPMPQLQSSINTSQQLQSSINTSQKLPSSIGASQQLQSSIGASQQLQSSIGASQQLPSSIQPNMSATMHSTNMAAPMLNGSMQQSYVALQHSFNSQNESSYSNNGLEQLGIKNGILPQNPHMQQQPHHRNTLPLPSERTGALPLHVPIQSNSPTLPGQKRALVLPPRGAQVPACPQPVFSQEPTRAQGNRPQPISDAEMSAMSDHVTNDAEVSSLQTSVHELKQAIHAEEFNLEQQIMALQRQHEAAQSKLQHLMQHPLQGSSNQSSIQPSNQSSMQANNQGNMQALDQPGMQQDMQSMPHSSMPMNMQQNIQQPDLDKSTDKVMPVSPAISPITVTSEYPATNNNSYVDEQPRAPANYVLTSQTREIKVSLPRMDFNESADQSH